MIELIMCFHDDSGKWYRWCYYFQPIKSIPLWNLNDDGTIDWLSLTFSFTSRIPGFKRGEDFVVESIKYVLGKDQNDKIQYITSNGDYDDNEEDIWIPYDDEDYKAVIDDMNPTFEQHYDTHWNCWCKKHPQRVCGCSCDSKHDGW